MNLRPTSLATVALLLSASFVVAQEENKVEAAVEKWLSSDHTSQELLEATVKLVLAEEKRGLPHVGKLLTASGEKPRALRTKGIRTLATHVSLGFLQRETSGSVVFAGQYDRLQPLQPFVTDLFFSWLIDTPTWYPETHRIHLVPALRDLQPTLPAAQRLGNVLEIVENVAIEPESLRSALSCMLWQWGKKKYMQPRLDELKKKSSEGEAEDRVAALIELANLQYALRDYKASAVTHQTVQLLAVATGFGLKPVDWYSAACVNALLGDVDRGIEALSKCVELQASLDVDSSHKVDREVFQEDPEIEALRSHARFADLLAKALKHSPKAKSGRR